MSDPNTKWHGGLSDCCEAPIKVIGEGLTALICSDCDGLCNEKMDEEDFEDFY